MRFVGQGKAFSHFSIVPMKVLLRVFAFGRIAHLPIGLVFIKSLLLITSLVAIT